METRIISRLVDESTDRRLIKSNFEGKKMIDDRFIVQIPNIHCLMLQFNSHIWFMDHYKMNTFSFSLSDKASRFKTLKSSLK